MMDDKISRNLTLDDNEIILKIVRQSWHQLFFKLALAFVLIAADFFMLFTLLSYGSLGLVIFGLVLLSGIFYSLRLLIIWWGQTLIITNQKITDVDRKGLFKKTVSTVKLADMQDVFYETKGVIQTIFKSGNIKIILADGKTRIDLNNIAQPQTIQKIILQNKQSAGKPNATTEELSATELLNIIKKIKQSLGEEKFNEIINH